MHGLRAIAVTMVLLFHFELLGAQGGFAGVDVFFVLSGFLMTKMLVHRQDQAAWPLLRNFLVRRFWRIAPAYFVVVIATLVLGWFVLLPTDYEKLAESAGSSLLFLSNYYFKSQAGYFEDAATYKLLLHTWSLAVEMQFYLIWPLAFLLTRRLKEVLAVVALFVTIAASWLLADHLNAAHPDMAFFAVFTRLWQFGAGALVATPWVIQRLPARAIESMPVQAVALFSILMSTFMLDEHLTWPVPWALIPTIATMVLIAGNLSQDNNGIARLLSWSPLVFVGEISYSLYLVHWPIVGLIYLLWWPQVGTLVSVVALISTFPLAWLLYRFVETPMRARDQTGNRIRFNNAALCSIVAAIAAGSAVVLSTSGLPQRFSPEIRPALMGDSRWLEDLPKAQNCGAPDANCNTSESTKGTVFLWGDSHAERVAKGLSIMSAEQGYKFAYEVSNGCPPGEAISFARHNWSINSKCESSNRIAYDRLQNTQDLRTVVLVARWALYATTVNRTGARHYTIKSDDDVRSIERSRENLTNTLDSLSKTLAQRGANLLILTQVPEFPFSPIRCFQYAAWLKKSDTTCNVPRSEVDQREQPYRAILQDLATRNPNVQVLDIIDSFCDAEGCRATLMDDIAYTDTNHVTDAAALHVLRKHNPNL